jgi:hypothetical protein
MGHHSIQSKVTKGVHADGSKMSRAMSEPQKSHVQPKQPMELELSAHSATCHGDVVFQVISSFAAQSVDLSAWQDVQAFGEINLKACELTNERQGQRFVISPLWRWVKSQGRSNCLVWKSTAGFTKRLPAFKAATRATNIRFTAVC